MREAGFLDSRILLGVERKEEYRQITRDLYTRNSNCESIRKRGIGKYLLVAYS